MRFTLGVVVGMALGRPVLTRIYRPLHPIIVAKLYGMAYDFVENNVPPQDSPRKEKQR